MLFSDLFLICYPNFRRIRRSRFSLNMKLIKGIYHRRELSQNIFRYLSFIPLDHKCDPVDLSEDCKKMSLRAVLQNKIFKNFFVIFLSNRQWSHLWPHRGWDKGSLLSYPFLPNLYG